MVEEKKETKKPYVIAVFNQKGGVGKTTTSTNLALCLAAYNRSVVLIDLDSQGNATTSLGLNPAPSSGAYDILMGTAGAKEARSSTIFPKLSIFASSESLAGIDFDLALTEQPQGALRRFLESSDLNDDYVIIDCPPTFSMLPVNALVAADAVVIPVHPTPLAHDGLIKAWGNIKRIQAKMNPTLGVHGILVAMADSGDTERRMERVIRQEFGDKVYDTVVPRDNRVTDAAVKDLPVVVFDPGSIATRHMVDFAEEFLLREPILRQRRYPGEAKNIVHIEHFNADEHKQAVAAALRTIGKWHEELGAYGQSDFITDSLSSDAPHIEATEHWSAANKSGKARNIPWGTLLAAAICTLGFILGLLVGASEQITRVLTSG